MSFRLLPAIAAVALLSGCQSDPLPQAGSLDAGFGEVAKYNAAVQIINPEPVYTADNAQPGDNGDKAANATKRYRSDAVKQPELPSSTKKSSGGGPQ